MQAQISVSATASLQIPLWLIAIDMRHWGIQAVVA